MANIVKRLLFFLERTLGVRWRSVVASLAMSTIRAAVVRCFSRKGSGKPFAENITKKSETIRSGPEESDSCPRKEDG